jgi:hypothetical protein
VTEIDVEQARRLLTTLRTDLVAMVAQDPEQEVRGLAVPAVDAALSAVRPLIANTNVMAKVADVISPDTIEQGEPVRAIDLRVVVNLMLAELPPPPPPPATGENLVGQILR